MKALAILAGPRKGCATDNLTDSILKGLEEKGAQTEKIHLYHLDIKPCTGCLTCEKTNTCTINDDHQMVLDKMDETDTVIFASPTYWSNVTSVAKAFMDRSIRFFTITKFGPKRFSNKPSKVILVTSCGAPFPISHILGVVPGCLRAMKVFFQRMNVTIKTIAATGMVNADSKPCEKLLKRAYRLGKNIS